MHSVSISPDSADDKYAAHSAASASAASRKGSFGQRLRVQLNLLLQRCMGRRVVAGGSSKRAHVVMSGDRPCSNLSPRLRLGLLLLLQLLLFGYIFTLRRELANQARSRDSSSLSLSFPTPSDALPPSPVFNSLSLSQPSRERLWSELAQQAGVGAGEQQQQQQIVQQQQLAQQPQQPLQPSSSVALPAAASEPSSSAVSSPTPLAWEWSVDSYAREREIYTTLADEEAKRTPEIVRSFRAGKVEWHNLLPAYTRSGSEELNFARLVASEQALTKYLTYDYNLHTHWAWGGEHGPMRDFASCRRLHDKCNVHSRTDCMHNGACGWCERAQLCVDRFARPLPYDEHEHKPACAPEELTFGAQNTNVRCNGPLTLYARGQRGQRVDNAAQCKAIVTDRVVEAHINPNAGAMFYHFFREHLEPLYESSWRGGRIDDRYTHVVVASGSSDHFHDWYGPFTRLCPRYTSEMPDGLCFCAPEHATADGPRPALTDDARLPPSSGVVDAIVRNLGLEHVRPPRDRPALGMVSREHKRFILNELELARIAVEQGVSFKLLPLEYMTVYEQVREFRRLHWLVGIHGSGLINVLFLHTQQSASDAGASHQPGLPPLPPNQSHLSGDAAIAARVMLKQSFRQYCLQVMPYAVRIGGEFFRPMAQQVGCQYEEWLQPKRSNTVIHTHFLGANEFRNLDALMQRGPASQDGLFFSFWINQDTIIDPDDWRALLRRMIEA